MTENIHESIIFSITLQNARLRSACTTEMGMVMLLPQIWVQLSEVWEYFLLTTNSWIYSTNKTRKVSFDNGVKDFFHLAFSMITGKRFFHLAFSTMYLNLIELTPCCQIYRVTEVAETAVWSIPFLINMFNAFKGSQFFFYFY